MIISKTKKPNMNQYNGESCFEQRSDSAIKKKFYYFHQPTLLIPISPDGKKIVDHFVPKMRDAILGCGIGLAHSQYPQENNAKHPYSIFVIEMAEKNIKFEAFINATIVGYSKTTSVFAHGCLSALDFARANMNSFSEVLVAYYPESLDKIIIKKFTDFSAIIVQHELSHILQNETYIDILTRHYKGNIYKVKQHIQNSEDNSNDNIFYNIKQIIPSLISKDTLAKCKQFLLSHDEYRIAITNYLQNNPIDIPLYENLMQLTASRKKLYFNEYHNCRL